MFPVDVPPLRERVEDVTLLAFHFLERICRDLGRDPLRMTRQQVSVLKQQQWPGNIRELKNVIERAVISSAGDRLRLDLALTNVAVENHSPSSQESADPPEFLTLSEFKELEKANITAALRSVNWKVWGPEGAADLLGAKPSTLAYQMKMLGIEKPR